MKSLRFISAIILLCVTFPLSAQIDLDRQSAEAMAFFQQKEYNKAIACFEEIITSIQDTPQKDAIPQLKEILAMIHLVAGQTLYDKKQYDEGSLHFDKALALAQKGTEAYKQIASVVEMYKMRHYIDDRFTIADKLRERKEYEKAIFVYEEALDSIKGTALEYMNDGLRESIAICHLYWGSDYFNISQTEEARRHFELAIANTQEGSNTCKRAHSMMGEWYSVQVRNLCNSNQYNEQTLAYSLKAEEHFDKAKNITERLKEQLYRVNLLQELSRNNEAEALLNQIVRECENKKEFDAIRGAALIKQGDMEAKAENLQAAVEHLVAGYELCKDEKDKTNAYLAASILQRIYLYKIPDTKKELFWKQIAEALKPLIETQSNRPFHSNQIIDWETANANFADQEAYCEAVENIVQHKNYRKAIDMLTSLIRRSEQQGNYPKDALSQYYKARAQGWLRSDSLDNALQDEIHTIKLLDQAGDAGEADKSAAWYLLAIIYYHLNDTTMAMQAVDSCVTTSESYYGSYHSNTLKAYSLRSNLEGFYNLKTRALNDQLKLFEIIQKNVEQNFVYLTSTERTAYWESVRGETTSMFIYAHKMDERQSLFTDALYNQQLLSKGILLTTETALQRSIDNDVELANVYKQIQALRKKASDERTSISEAKAAILEADRLERSLGESANSLHRFTEVLKVHVEDVKTKLGKQDIAVEFVDYQIGKDSTMYAALVLSPEIEHVIFIPLFEEKELPEVSSKLYERLWKPILQMVGEKQISNIYFSPTGRLYQQPIESASMESGKYMTDCFNMYRLSSTRWLTNAKNHSAGQNAAIYGGLLYDTSIAEMQEDAARYPKTRTVISAPSSPSRGNVGLNYLKWTKEEAEKIAVIINNQAQPALHANLYLGKKGTEAAFKALDSQHTRIIHLATHGSYEDTRTTGDNPADDALRNSILYFSGALNKYLGEELPPDVEDGILTAEEVSLLDLSGLEIAVLSACQTAQGHIGNDGVFGLQRGFKKAGAQSLLMSLWNVDDQATSLLMTEFYRNWIVEGLTKHQAFEKAKQTVRSHTENGWDNPRYWSAFVLIDAWE